jgi:formate dehydrogenase major subunit
MSAVRLTINGHAVDVEDGATILDAARKAGFEIPTLCHRDELKPFGSCFLCVVEVKGKANLVPSCATRAADGMEVRTDSERIRASRRTCLELLLSDHVGDCVGPCMTACPAHIDIPGFIDHIAAGRFEDALRLIRLRMPFPGMLGRVCPAPCEDACRRAGVDEPISVCRLKRAPYDLVSDEIRSALPAQRAAGGKRVAIVGAGPAGLSAAWYLQLSGHACTVFEANEAPGGMMRYGIPRYRLPHEIIDAEAGMVQALGAEFRTGARIGDAIALDDLRRDFEAVFVGVGAGLSTSMHIPGEDLPGVVSGIDYLAAAARDDSFRAGRRVMVVGGGNTAIDAARTAVRSGAESVQIVYRRAREQMPAWDEEVEDAEAEGVRVSVLQNPIRIEPRAGGGLDVTCIRMRLGEPDAGGRRRPLPIEDTEHILSVDQVVMAIGQKVDASPFADLAADKWGCILADPKTLQTSDPKVFAGGDCVTGPAIAVDAVAAGRRAAHAIDSFLRTGHAEPEPEPYFHTLGSNDDAPADIFDGFERAARLASRHAPPEDRRTFREVDQGFSADMARAEAERCMACGCRDARECKLREYAAEYGARQDRYAGEHRSFARDASHADILFEPHKCIQCGICVRLEEEAEGGRESMGFTGRGFDARVEPALGRPFERVARENAARVEAACPTGALTRKDAPVPVLEKPDAGEENPSEDNTEGDSA